MQNAKQYITKQARGPHRFCNWVVYPGVIEPGRILMSAYPYRTHLKKLEKNQYASKREFYKQVAAFPKGVTYICLQEKTEIARLKLPVYFTKKQLVKAQKKTGVKHVRYDNGLEIVDISVTKDDLVYKYVCALYEAYIKGENFVIHCLGGHGRTGTIAGLLMGFILARAGVVLKASELLELIQHCHTQRVQCNGWVACPQTSSQCQQVQNIYYRYLRAHKIDYIAESLKFDVFGTVYKSSASHALKLYDVHSPAVTDAMNWQRLSDLSDLFKDPITESKTGDVSDSDSDTDSDSDKETLVGSDSDDDEKKPTKAKLSDWFSCLPCFSATPSPKKAKKPKEAPKTQTIPRETPRIPPGFEKKTQTVVPPIYKDLPVMAKVSQDPPFAVSKASDEDTADVWDMSSFWETDFPVHETKTPPPSPDGLVDITASLTCDLPTLPKKGIRQLKPLTVATHYSKVWDHSTRKMPNTQQFEMSDLI